jgi:hypothetical protein
MASLDLNALMKGANELPITFDEHPVGAAIFAGLVSLALICWVIVTWLKSRRS